MDEVDLRNVASSPQFRKAQEEDRELQALRAQALDARNSQTVAPVGTSHYEIRNQLLYRVQKQKTAE